MTERSGPRTAVLVTCEHGGNRVPARYRSWFAGAQSALDSHRGFDAGALAMAHTLARTLDAELLVTTVSRLVVELNRSLCHPQLFSRFTQSAPQSVRAEIFERYYVPYWRAAHASVARAVRRNRCVVHIGAHSFTPVLDGDVRRADIGLLYDPKRPCEVALCAAWRNAIRDRAPQWKVRRNYPYAGASDGLTTALRRTFPPSRYLGLELEINQRLPLGGGPAWQAMRRTIAEALAEALASAAEPTGRRTAGTQPRRGRSNETSDIALRAGRSPRERS